MRLTQRTIFVTGILALCSTEWAGSSPSPREESGDGDGLVVAHGSPPRFDSGAYDEKSRLRDRGVDVEAGGGLMPLLATIRADWPELRGITARMDHQPGVLLLMLERSLAELVLRSLAKEGTSGRFLTGVDAFDRLNAEIGLRGVQSSRFMPEYFVFWFDPDADEIRAAQKYEALQGVSGASIDGMVGDSSDIDALWDGERWHIVFRKAWGDCPAGCIYSELSFFTGDSGGVAAVDPILASGMPGFREIVHRRGWRFPESSSHTVEDDDKPTRPSVVNGTG